MDFLRRAADFFSGRQGEGDRKNGGTETVQIGYECEWTDRVDWESDLHERLVFCAKNPGHNDFIPIEEIALEHLPQKYQDNEVLEFVKVTGELTVRLVVSHTSTHRPDKFPKNKEEIKRVLGYSNLVGKPYPYANYKGKSGRRVGTGRVVYVDRVNTIQTQLTGPCVCDDGCKTSSSPKKDWGRIYVKTAAHVICAEDEANKCQAEFFYNRSVDKTAGKVKLLSGANMYKSSVERDGCEIVFTTHDTQLLDRLKFTERRWRNLQDAMTMRNRLLPETSLPFFIVSHPHGMDKMVTWGWVKKEEKGLWLGDEQVIYTVPTCPGSSGAAVVCVGKIGHWDDGYHHSGAVGAGLGRSGCWFFSASSK